MGNVNNFEKESDQSKQTNDYSTRTCLSALGEEQKTPEELQSMGQGIMSGRLDIDRDYN